VKDFNLSQICPYTISTLSVCEHLSITLRRAEQICMKLGIYIMAPGPISTAYVISPANQSTCLYVYPTIVARQRLSKVHPSFHC
jgi:hypothetical protein